MRQKGPRGYRCWCNGFWAYARGPPRSKSNAVVSNLESYWNIDGGLSGSSNLGPPHLREGGTKRAVAANGSHILRTVQNTTGTNNGFGEFKLPSRKTRIITLCAGRIKQKTVLCESSGNPAKLRKLRGSVLEFKIVTGILPSTSEAVSCSQMSTDSPFTVFPSTISLNPQLLNTHDPYFSQVLQDSL